MKCLSALGINDQNPGASDGQSGWLPSSTDVIDTINPANEKRIASVCQATQTDYQHIKQHAKAAFLRWRQVPAPKRGEVVRQIGNALRQHKDELGTLVSLEMGKSKQEGDGEVQEMIDMADFCVGQSRMLYGLSMHSEREQHRMYEQWQALGVVGVITAFNFPVAVWAWNAFVAAICGNSIIWRPSPKTPLCAIALQNICNTVMADNQCPGVFSTFVSDDIVLAQHFVDDRDIALVSFTGSTAVGQQVASRVAQRMGRYLLECGGNNAIIVDQSADLKLALPAIVFGAVGTAGQRCTTTRRLIVHASVYDKLKASLVDAYAKIRIGDPLDAKNHMGPVIDQDAVDQYVAAIEQCRQQGGQCLAGGQALAQTGFYVQPSLLSAHADWAIVQQETFAPILYLMSYQHLDEAIAMQNNAAEGLSSALFTRDFQSAERFLSVAGSDCGIANINIGTSGAEIGGAFGGEKATGGGREAGSDAWKAYMRRQTSTLNWGQTLPLAQGIQFSID